MKKKLTWLFLILTTLLFAFLFSEFFSNGTFYVKSDEIVKPIKKIPKLTLPLLDTVAYDKKINELANNPLPQKPTTKIVKDLKTGKETTVTTEQKPTPPNIWPIKTVYPSAGALLPIMAICIQKRWEFLVNILQMKCWPN